MLKMFFFGFNEQKSLVSNCFFLVSINRKAKSAIVFFPTNDFWIHDKAYWMDWKNILWFWTFFCMYAKSSNGLKEYIVILNIFLYVCRERLQCGGEFSWYVMKHYNICYNKKAKEAFQKVKRKCGKTMNG